MESPQGDEGLGFFRCREGVKGRCREKEIGRNSKSCSGDEDRNGNSKNYRENVISNTKTGKIKSSVDGNGKLKVFLHKQQEY